MKKKYKEACYFSVELHPDLSEQPKISMNCSIVSVRKALWVLHL